MIEKKSALLVMDYIEAILQMNPNIDETIQKTKQLLKKARKENLFIIHVKLGFQEHYPEISQNNTMFKYMKETFTSDSFDRFHPLLKPQEGETIVTKRRISAFASSELEVVLRSNDINHLILCGISTSGVVLSTLCEAFDKDYKVSVVSDCCADSSKELHDNLIKNFFPMRGEVLNSNDMFNK